MKFEIVKVTPSIAAHWLQANTHNRPLRRNVVEGFKAALLRGEYVPTHQGIAFAEGGTLLDGQHRLTAISELPGGEYPMLVTSGLDVNAFRVLDIGVRRTAADVLSRDTRIVAVARFYASILVTNKSQISPTFLEPIIEGIEPYHGVLVSFCPSVTRMWSSAPVQAAAVYQMMRGCDADYIRMVYRALVTRDFKGMPAVAQMIYRAHMSGTIRAQASNDAFLRMLRVFDPSDSDLKIIKIVDPSSRIAEVRDGLMQIFSLGRNDSGKKKAAPKGAAKSGSQSNYRTARQ